MTINTEAIKGPIIPWNGGTVRFDAVPAQDFLKDGSQLGPGRWALHPRSTVPYVRIDVGRASVREFTWGEVYEVPEAYGRVFNASFHAGDIILSAVPRQSQAPHRPAGLTVPAFLRVSTLTVPASIETRVIDVRHARRVFLVNPLATTPQGGLNFEVIHTAPTRGIQFAPGTGAASKNELVEAHSAFTFARMLAVGIGAGENRDNTAANSTLPENRPQAVLDTLQVRFPQAEAIAAGFGLDADAFFLLEY